MPEIDDHIQKAMNEGKFDDLPGKGKPLHLEDNPHEDAAWKMAYHLLRQGGFSLPWIELRQEIEAELEQARAALRRTWEWRQAALAQGQNPAAVQSEWQRAVEQFSAQLTQLNQRIRDYNLQAPSTRFQRPLLKLERELEDYRSI